MPKKKECPPRPIVAIKAHDWAGYEDNHIESKQWPDCDLMEAWIVGFLLFEDKRKIVLAREHFHNDDNCRHVIVISKSTITARVDY